MKLLLSLAIVALLGLSGVRAQSPCNISDSVNKGTNNVKFILSPSPADLLKAAQMEDNKSIPALINLLTNSATNPAINFANSIIGQVNTMSRAIPFIPLIPTCRPLNWISGEFFCDNVPSSILRPLCTLFPSIKNITAPIKIPLPIPVPQGVPLACESDKRWGLTTVNASGAWAQGFNGAGVVVANLDTGVRATHEELRDNFRSTYNFYNAYNTTNSTPVDDNGHGTHTMGSICGKTVGVAPGATWIACKGCGNSGCDNEQLLLCGQWLLCPDNQKLNCTTRPDVINNSWGGGIGNTFYQSALLLMKQAGIINFFSSGNSGPACSTVMSPADGNGTQFNTISVGASTCEDKIASFSSTGPSQAADFMGQLGVRIIGPGQMIYSAWNTNDTATNIISGTSMSSPHVTGAGAVLLSKNKAMSFAQVREALESTAYRRSDIANAAVVCGGDPNSNNILAPYPNNVYGYGRFDLPAALDAC